MTDTIKLTRRAATMEEGQRKAMCRLLKYDAFGDNDDLRKQWFGILKRIEKRAAQCVKQQIFKKQEEDKDWVSVAEMMPNYLQVLQKRMGDGNG